MLSDQTASSSNLQPSTSHSASSQKSSSNPHKSTGSSTVNRPHTSYSASSMDCDTETSANDIEENTLMDQEEVVDQKVVSQCLSEPVLCREALNGQIPAMLREMYEFLQPANELEALGVVFHVLMIETGFCVQTEVMSLLSFCFIYKNMGLQVSFGFWFYDICSFSSGNSHPQIGRASCRERV